MYRSASPREHPRDPRIDPKSLLCELCRPHARQRVVSSIDPPRNAADPTQAYRLACGHVVI